MRREMEYAKKIVLIRKLFREGMLSDQEYSRIRQKLMEAYAVISGSMYENGVFSGTQQRTDTDVAAAFAGTA